jgi:transglutaminase-like putative cysteine protease
VVATSAESDFAEATVDVGVAQPITASRKPGAPYLRDDRNITPRHPEVRKRAAMAAGGSKDPAAMVQSLLRWVYGYIDYELQSEILTTPEILAKRKGRCAEYAVLIASAARAMGVPTKIVVGFYYHNGVWGGHMWNEVWLGR